MKQLGILAITLLLISAIFGTTVYGAGLDLQLPTCNLTGGTIGGRGNFTENTTVSAIITVSTNSTSSTSTISLGLASSSNVNSGRGNRTGANLAFVNGTGVAKDNMTLSTEFTNVPDGIYNLTAVLYFNNNTDDNLTALVASCDPRTITVNAESPKSFPVVEEDVELIDVGGIKGTNVAVVVIVLIVGYLLISGKLK